MSGIIDRFTTGAATVAAYFRAEAISPDQVTDFHISCGEQPHNSFSSYFCRITLLDGRTREASLGNKNAHTLVHAIPSARIKSDFNVQEIGYCSKRILPSANEVLSTIFASRQEGPIDLKDLPG
jgi:hypothetical protein